MDSLSARIRYAAGADTFEVISDYHEKAIEAWKAAVPLTHRRWSEEDHRWTFNLDFYPQVERILLSFYDHVTKEMVLPTGEVEVTDLITGEITTQGNLFR